MPEPPDEKYITDKYNELEQEKGRYRKRRCLSRKLIIKPISAAAD